MKGDPLSILKHYVVCYLFVSIITKQNPCRAKLVYVISMKSILKFKKNCGKNYNLREKVLLAQSRDFFPTGLEIV